MIQFLEAVRFPETQRSFILSVYPNVSTNGSESMGFMKPQFQKR